ncbi:MAG: flagellar biosynthesis anti-sigma factor FlgM [Dehalococcoidales bacterium]|nr:flagellar biosynthesis anti-sigma factor FlgM [Dehalococcoidales bacterium]
MRIDNGNLNSHQVAETREKCPVEHAKGGQRTDKPTRTGDSVDLSPRSRELLLMHRKLEETPDVREELVQSLRDQVQKGTYRPSGKQIAAKMMEELGDLFRG